MCSAMTRFATGGNAMRHDPASAAVMVMLRGLKMYGMTQAVGELIEQGAPAFDNRAHQCFDPAHAASLGAYAAGLAIRSG
jgi:hypothetical protein